MSFFPVFHLILLFLVPALFSTIQFGVSRICTLYFYHAIALCYDSPLMSIFLDYLFCNQIFSFLHPNLIMWCSTLSLSHRLEFFLSQPSPLSLCLAALNTTLPSCNKATNWHRSNETLPHQHAFSYINCVWATRYIFVFLTPQDGTNRLCGNVGKKLQLLDA